MEQDRNEREIEKEEAKEYIQEENQQDEKNENIRENNQKVDSQEIKQEEEEVEKKGGDEEKEIVKEEEKQKKEKEQKERKEEEKKQKEKFSNSKKKLRFMSSEWYDKNYKFMLIIWIIICLAIIGQLVYMYSTTGDIMIKDVSLTGGTVISVYSEEKINSNEMINFISQKVGEKVFFRTLNDITTGKQVAFVVETKAPANETKRALEEYLKYSLTSDNSTTEITGSNLSKSFYKQLLIALTLAFIFMGIVVFIIFKKPIPSLAIIQCGVFDTLGALAIANVFGIRMSTAGIAALLMLAGYSVDTDTLLTTKVLKRRGESTLNSRIKSAFKTGVIMTLTSLIGVLIAYFIVPSPVLKQIFFVLSSGLIVDLFGTWLGNASILKWYCKKKNIE